MADALAALLALSHPDWPQHIHDVDFLNFDEFDVSTYSCTVRVFVQRCIISFRTWHWYCTWYIRLTSKITCLKLIQCQHQCSLLKLTVVDHPLLDWIASYFRFAIHIKGQLILCTPRLSTILSLHLCHSTSKKKWMYRIINNKVSWQPQSVYQKRRLHWVWHKGRLSYNLP